jgi:hypothetical protein
MPGSERPMTRQAAAPELRVRLLVDPCLWCWEIADPSGDGASLYSSWANEWRAYQSREEARRAGEAHIAALARAA